MPRQEPRVSDEDFIACYKKHLALSESKTVKAVARRMAEELPYTPDYVRNRIKRIKKRLTKSEAVADPAVVNQNEKKIKGRLGKKVSTFLITWAQNATPVHRGFYESVMHFCEHKNAQLIVIPGRYKNPTSIFSQKGEEYWCDEVAKHLMNKRVRLNDNLVVMGDIKTQPTAVNPLSGFETITHDKSGVFGHPKVQLKSIATPQNKLPKLLTTTGAITMHNYTDSKAGKKGEFHHTLGATLVEVVGDEFYMRQINALDDGSFIDLRHEYSPSGVSLAKRPLALVMGDIHADFMDESCERVTFFERDGIVSHLEPEAIVVHDWYDGYSGSHHHKRKPFTQFAKHHSGKNNVEREIERTFEKLRRWAKCGADFHIVASNHNDHLLRWLEEGEPKNDPENAVFYHELMAVVLRGTTMGESGAEVPNPLELLARERLGLDCVHFHGRRNALMIGGIDCSQHGDIGANGSRGSTKQFASFGVKMITGHSHGPEIDGGSFRVGTNSNLQLEYNAGASNWLHTDCLIYANGKRTLIHKIDGKWKAKRRGL